MRDLALQIGQADGIEIDDAEGADARRRQIEDHRAAQPARSDHQHARRLEARLARAAHLAQHDVAGVTLKLRIAEIHRISHRGRRGLSVLSTSYARILRPMAAVAPSRWHDRCCLEIIMDIH